MGAGIHCTHRNLVVATNTLVAKPTFFIEDMEKNQVSSPIIYLANFGAAPGFFYISYTDRRMVLRS